jgi:hypothetical protein
MKLEQLKSLSEDELVLLWGCINLVEPKIVQSYDLEPSLFPSINHRKLMDKLTNCKTKIKEDHHALFDGLLNKLRI